MECPVYDWVVFLFFFASHALLHQYHKGLFIHLLQSSPSLSECVCPWRASVCVFWFCTAFKTHVVLKRPGGLTEDSHYGFVCPRLDRSLQWVLNATFHLSEMTCSWVVHDENAAATLYLIFWPEAWQLVTMFVIFYNKAVRIHYYVLSASGCFCYYAFKTGMCKWPLVRLAALYCASFYIVYTENTLFNFMVNGRGLTSVDWICWYF